MTNFSDPAVQLKDFGAYAFALGAGLWILDRLMKLFSTAALQSFWHVIHGIYMYVRFAVPTSRSHVQYINPHWHFQLGVCYNS